MATLDELRLQQLLSPFNNQNNQVNNSGITGASSAIPNINGVPMINTGAINQKLQNTDLVSQIIAANQTANANKFGNTVSPFPGNQVPQINNQVNSQVPFNDFYDSVYTPYDPEKDNEQVDYLPGQSSFKDKAKDSLSGLGRKMGISSLIGMITGNPIIGLIGRGIGALTRGSKFVGPKGSTGYGNDSALALFRRSSTGAQFFQGLRDKRAREDAAKRGAAKANMAEARAITNRISSAPTGGGGGGNPGTTTGGSSRDAGTGGTFGTSSNNNSSFSDYS